MLKFILPILFLLSTASAFANPFAPFAGRWYFMADPIVQATDATKCVQFNMDHTYFISIMMVSRDSSYLISFDHATSNGGVRSTEDPLQTFWSMNEYGINSGVLSGNEQTAEYVQTISQEHLFRVIRYKLIRLDSTHSSFMITDQEANQQGNYSCAFFYTLKR
jgi:hypothetical protein